jgi:cytochrome c oxidase subunit 3
MTDRASENLPLQKAVPVGRGPLSTGRWGIWTLIVTEASLFGYLLLSYAILGLQSPTPWPPNGPPELSLAIINTVILLSSSVFVGLCEAMLARDKRRAALGLLAVAIGLGVIFVGIQLKEWSGKPFGLRSHTYGSLFFTITGFHMAHVVVGVVSLAMVWLWIVMRLVDKTRREVLTLAALYWHFVDAVWLVIFSLLYGLPHVVA